MTVPVRPPVWPPAPADIRPGRNDARLAAQKAFFEAAMGARPATAAVAPAAAEPRASAAEAARATAKTAASAESAKLPPPGTHLDIWV